ncbi:MarR family winged helix-turn-helix transcriptional regulator [Dysgonomonas macrotermitis]|uniref:DNA-binding transcriptional regulator, MarR family n=1 Tax=Dysgonomonas macrotermitis TaxID=1346286 RepID=A0A1M5DQ48_9BACT|nr:MarR family transcriptional regulator [Dysgonomonas macrotermitis]SHF69158.1 DNA-binding transcriptional regulator, MarR family [Dysgonomonas macrotermitis]
MQEFVYAILMVQATYRQAIYKELRALGIDLSFEMLHIIRRLYNQDRIKQQELAALTYKDKSSLSYLLNNMEKKNLIKRIEDKNDKRNKLVILTEEGRARHEQIQSIVGAVYHKVETNVDMDRLKRCTAYLKELNEIISND